MKKRFIVTAKVKNQGYIITSKNGEIYVWNSSAEAISFCLCYTYKGIKAFGLLIKEVGEGNEKFLKSIPFPETPLRKLIFQNTMIYGILLNEKGWVTLRLGARCPCG